MPRDVHSELRQLTLVRAECHESEGFGIVSASCMCTCDGEMTRIRDPRCAGFEGELMQTHSPVIEG